MCYRCCLGDNYIEAIGKTSGRSELLRGVLKPYNNFAKLGKSFISK